MQLLAGTRLGVPAATGEMGRCLAVADGLLPFVYPRGWGWKYLFIRIVEAGLVANALRAFYIYVVSQPVLPGKNFTGWRPILSWSRVMRVDP